MTSPFRARRHALRLSVGEDGRIVEVDPYGNSRHDKRQYVIRKDRVYETDSYGRIRYDKPYYAVGKDGRVVRTDAYGHKRYDRPQYKVEGVKVYETDAYGRVNSRSSSSRRTDRSNLGAGSSGLPGGTPVEAERACAIRHEQQQPAGDRHVLEEHDHFDLVAEIAVEKNRCQ